MLHPVSLCYSLYIHFILALKPGRRRGHRQVLFWRIDPETASQTDRLYRKEAGNEDVDGKVIQRVMKTHPHMQKGRRRDRQVERQTDKQTDRKTDGPVDRTTGTEGEGNAE